MGQRCTSFCFLQAEDGIRDATVTGVQTCCSSDLGPAHHPPAPGAEPGGGRRAAAGGRRARLARAERAGLSMDLNAGSGTEQPPGTTDEASISTGWREPVAPAGARLSHRRRRPSGKPAPLPRELGVSGKLWVGAVAALVVFMVLLFTVPIGDFFDRSEGRFLAWLSGIRTGWLTRRGEVPGRDRSGVAEPHRPVGRDPG